MTFGNLKQGFICCIVVSLAMTIITNAMAQDLQLDTKALEAPNKKPAAKKPKDMSISSDPSTERKAGGPDRQFGELEGWSPGKEPPKDPKDPNNTKSSASTTGGAKVSTTPSGNMGMGFGF
ncbi:MAG: hypothetical protein ACKOEW_05765 [Methylocystis sp.]